jgi:TPR repeat protein
MRCVLAAGFLAGLALSPAASWAQNTAARACDLAAASPLDSSRPAGIPGVDIEKVDITAAMPPCKAALAVQPESPRLLYEMGRIFLIGKDYAQAHIFFERAAASSYAVARHDLAFFYLLGRGGVAKDEAQGIALLTLASEQGLAAADYELGIFHENGRAGLPKDTEQAIRHFMVAADRGYAMAQAHLGVIYGTGSDGVPKDEVKAAKLFKLAAAQGYRVGQFNLGLLYENGGGGLPKSDTEAARLYKLAADQKLPDAEYRLALFYEAGRGGLPKDKNEELRLLKLAAEHGSMSARLSLGGSFGAGGVSVPLDWANAFREHLRKYWNLPRGVDANSNLRVTLLIKLNPDGTLSQTPTVIEGSAAPAAAEFAQSALKALERAQPFTMLKVENYNQWKEMQLVFDSRMFANAGGGGAVDVGGMTDAAGTEGPH